MPRVKRGTIHLKRRKNILAQTKGFQHGRKKLIKLAKSAITHAGAYSYRDRRTKKRIIRGVWLIRLNAALREKDPKLTYSRFMGTIKNEGITLDRKILSTIAKDQPKIFESILKELSLIS